MQDSYLPIVILIAASALLTLGILVLSALLGRSKGRGTPKLYPYECGLPIRGSARQRFAVRFYVVAMLFILFDLETAFLFPWAVVFRRLGMYGLVSMFVFIGILLAGYAYAWRKGGFRWT